MLIFKSKYIPSPDFVEVNSIEDIKKTKPSDILVLKEFKAPFDLAKYCKENKVAYAIEANSILDALYASALEASYAIAEINLAKQLQKIADNYLWDMKILAKIANEEELEEIALNGIDGAIIKAKSIKPKA